MAAGLTVSPSHYGRASLAKTTRSLKRADVTCRHRCDIPAAAERAAAGINPPAQM